MAASVVFRKVNLDLLLRLMVLCLCSRLPFAACLSDPYPWDALHLLGRAELRLPVAGRAPLSSSDTFPLVCLCCPIRKEDRKANIE